KKAEVEVEKRPLFAVVPRKVDTKNKARKHKKSRTKMLLGTKETKIALALFAVLLVAGGIAAFIFLPSATIAINIQTAPLLVDQKLTIATNPAAVPNAVPGTVFSQQVQIQGGSPVTTTETIGTKATGTVKLINKTFDVQKIKEKSRLATKDGAIFYMVGSATIPASSASEVASTTVQVEAADAGEKGNLQPQHLDFAALDDSAQKLVYGEVETALTGGSGQVVKVVGDSDLDAAHEAAKSQAKAQVEQQAKAQLQSGFTLLDESWDVKLDAFQPAQKTGDKAENVVFTATATAKVFGYQESVLNSALQSALTSHLDANSSLFPGPLSFTKSVDSTDWDKGLANITARVTHSTIPNFSLDTLKDKLVGRSKDEANTYLSNLPGVQTADLKLWPFWVQSIPSIQQRINISINPIR
ncbi:MAG: baseplate J/gp47 family protein, partial [Candidatus Andersenbacteria bacterium]